MPTVDSCGRQPRKKRMRGRFGGRRHGLSTTYALISFCVLCLAGFPPKLARMLCCQGKRCRYIGRGCGSLHEGIGAPPKPLIIMQPLYWCWILHIALSSILSNIHGYLVLAWNYTFKKYLLLARKGCAHSLSLAARMPASLYLFRVESISLSLS